METEGRKEEGTEEEEEEEEEKGKEGSPFFLRPATTSSFLSLSSLPRQPPEDAEGRMAAAWLVAKNFIL